MALRAAALTVIAAVGFSCGSTARTSSGASVRWIAFHADPGGSDDLFLTTPDGSRRRRLTRGLEQVASPFWSPDGRRLAFLAPVGSPDVYVIRPDGRGLRRLTSGGGFFDLAWSPDSKRLAASRCAPPTCDLFVLSATQGRPRLLARESSQPAWSPDGRRIVFLSTRDGEPEIYVADADGSGQRRLTDSPGEDADAAWSPDGSSIAFDSKRTGNSQIYVMRPDGSDQRRLVVDGWYDAQPRWSPGGRRILFTSFRNRDPNLRGIGNAEIEVVDADGAELRNLTHSRFWEGDPAWSPGGTRLAFAVRRNFGPTGNFRVATMRSDGTRKRLLPPVLYSGRAANSCCPAWQPRDAR